MNVALTGIVDPKTLPDHKQLPDKDNIPVRNSQEPMQSSLLTDSLQPVLRRLHPNDDYYIGQDVGIYWRYTDPPLQGAKSPDWYYVSGVPRLLEGELRRSYVLWRELVSPYLILEFVSGMGDEERDRTPNEGKFWVYERRIRPAFYGIYEVDPGTIEMYHLVEDHFEPLAPNEHGRYPLPALGVELGIWHGRYDDTELPWMRWWDEQGNLLPTSAEIAEVEKQRAEKMAEKLRSLGINPDEL